MLDIEQLARFSAKILVSGEKDCWLWTACTNANGYGSFGVRKGVTKLAHRLAFEQAGGDIPSHLRVLHTCDRPACCNPLHLWLGTPADNSSDMVLKGRQASEINSGRGNHQYAAGPKLTRERAHEIRDEVGTHVAVAARYGVSSTLVSLIRRGKAWRDVD